MNAAEARIVSEEFKNRNGDCEELLVEAHRQIKEVAERGGCHVLDPLPAGVPIPPRVMQKLVEALKAEGHKVTERTNTFYRLEVQW